jgi:hypothetical protein
VTEPGDLNHLSILTARIVSQGGVAGTLPATSVARSGPEIATVQKGTKMAAEVSLPDVLARQGIHPETLRVPYTPGWDLAGTLVGGSMHAQAGEAAGFAPEGLHNDLTSTTITI